MRLIITPDDVDFHGKHPAPESISVKGRTFVNYILDEHSDGDIPLQTLLDNVEISESDASSQNDISDLTINRIETDVED